MTKPSPYQIMAFAKVAQELSFSRAARVLGVSQSSVTQHVGHLERTVGAHLFIRHRNGLELTRAGRELFDIADRWSALNDLFHERITNYTRLEEGHLTIIATVPSPALARIAEYNRLYPNVLIDFTLMNWTQCRAAIRNREADIAIVTDPDLGDRMFARKLEEVPYRAFMRRDHPLAGSRRLSLKRLQDETVVLTEDGSLTQHMLKAAEARHGLRFPKVIKMRTFAVVKEAILHGIGIGVLLDGSVAASDRIVSAPIDELPETYANYLVVPSDKEHLRPIRAFLDIAI